MTEYLSKKSTTRRNFIKKCGAFSICTMTIPVVTACEKSVVKGDTSGRTLDLDIRGDERYSALRNVGGIVAIDDGPFQVLAIRATQNRVTVINRLCTHAQADLDPGKEGSWDSAKLEMKCTFHDSVFDSYGRVIPNSGPAKEALTRYKVNFDPATEIAEVFLGEVDTISPEAKKQETDDVNQDEENTETSREGDEAKDTGEDSGSKENDGNSEVDDSKNDSTGESSNNEDPGTGNSNHSNSGQNQNELEIDLSDPKYSDLKIVGNALGIDYLSYKLLAIRVTQTKLNVLSRICTHQGADMALNKKGRWNPATDTLKCASHGSLFNSEGEVTGGGKASIDLRKYKVEFIPEKDYLKIDLKS